MKKLVFLSLLFFFAINSIFPQKEANTWYFYQGCGLDFNNEPPDILPGINIFRSSSCISNTMGEFLFATDGETVWNRNKQIMQNGSGLIGGGWAWHGAVTVQKPGSENLYYIFGTPNWINDTGSPPGFYYSVVDMNLDGGLGAVTNEKNVLLDAAWDAYEKVMAVHHANDKDVWIITRKHEFDAYAAFLLTKDGIKDSAIISPSPDRPFEYLFGSMKVSYDKKYFIAAYTDDGESADFPYETYDVCRFDAVTGSIDFLYQLKPALTNEVAPNSVEFSPDSKLVYLCNHVINSNDDYARDNEGVEFILNNGGDSCCP